MKRKNLILSIFALLLIACAVITPAVAYFTANTEADGAIPISFQYKTEIREDFKDWLKSVQIENVKNPVAGRPDMESDPIWVRARAFSGETYPLVEAPATAGDWIKQGDWWYYQKPLAAGELTSPITFEITGIPKKDAEDHMFTSFNVAVVYESTLVYYNEDGSVSGDAMTNANWTRILDTSGQP